MKLYVKNMVCDRCIAAVKKVVIDSALHPIAITLGEVQLSEERLTSEQRESLKAQLVPLGFELIDDRKSRTIEKIKNLVIGIVHYGQDEHNLKHSEYLSGELHQDYSSLSRLFSQVEGITIEQYIITQKIERARELLIYDELSLSEIADLLNYSSVAHMSSQFKKVTGMTPTAFKNLQSRPRKPLDEVGK
jgi:AraC-like DNA-binding protein